MRHGLIAVLFAIAGAVLGGCLGEDDEGSGSNGGGSINVAIVDNPQMQDLAHLTPSLFTAKSHIRLVGLGDRATALGGRLTIESPADGGTLVEAAIPLPGEVRPFEAGTAHHRK